MFYAFFPLFKLSVGVYKENTVHFGYQFCVSTYFAMVIDHWSNKQIIGTVQYCT